MKKLYMIKHVYYVDGGFGDAIYSEGVVGIVECAEEELNDFLKKYNHPVVYDEPYAYLTCHELKAEEISIKSLKELENDPYGDGDYYEDRIAFFKERDPKRFEECNRTLKEELEEEK